MQCDRNKNNCVPNDRQSTTTATSQPRTQAIEHPNDTIRRDIIPASAFSTMATKATHASRMFENPIEASVAQLDLDPFSVATQLYETLFFVRVRGNGKKVSRAKLGICPLVGDLFEKLADSAEVSAQSIRQVSICLPADIGKLQGLEIKAGEQDAFEFLISIISKGVVDVGATVPRRYILPTVVVLNSAD